ncbi:unnamed protein product [Prunus brigantina]
MNGCFLQSITTPRKACKGIEKLWRDNRGLTRPAWWSLIRASMAEPGQHLESCSMVV